MDGKICVLLDNKKPDGKTRCLTTRRVYRHKFNMTDSAEMVDFSANHLPKPDLMSIDALRRHIIKNLGGFNSVLEQRGALGPASMNRDACFHKICRSTNGLKRECRSCRMIALRACVWLVSGMMRLSPPRPRTIPCPPRAANTTIQKD